MRIVKTLLPAGVLATVLALTSSAAYAGSFDIPINGGVARIQINDNPVKWFTSGHPIRVAEQIAYLDILCGGRCLFGFGRGAAP